MKIILRLAQISYTKYLISKPISSLSLTKTVERKFRSNKRILRCIKKKSKDFKASLKKTNKAVATTGLPHLMNSFPMNQLNPSQFASIISTIGDNSLELRCNCCKVKELSLILILLSKASRGRMSMVMISIASDN